MSSQATPVVGRPRAFDTIVLGGMIAGFLDGMDAVLYYGWAADVSPWLLFQNIASGVLGPKAFLSGQDAAALGLILHFTIAFGAAAVFFLVSLALPVLYRKPWICGPLFGLLVYVVMHYVVVPLSLVPRRTVPMTGLELADQLFSHTMFVGLPIALMARRSTHE